MDELSNLFNRLQKNASSEIGFLDINLGKDFILEFLESYSKIAKKETNFEELLKNNPLESETATDDEIKHWLVHISTHTQPQAIEILKTLRQNPSFERLHAWAQMCDTILKANFKSEMLNENQMFMLTGMGGRDNKIRMFVGFVAENGSDFSPAQTKLLKNELEFTLKQHNGELESIEFEQEIAKAVFLLPFDAHIGDIINEAVTNANELGHYIKDNFLFTNHGILSKQEILDFFREKENKNDSENDDSQEDLDLNTGIN